ncbi:hypothetical protein LTR53_014451 [Teratosphaeriaceae sp. CCFEE 6253]|nr:hypothetical protein LTR53_014451 [Teratosphaeriaceae sp. CCFEE 6253]
MAQSPSLHPPASFLGLPAELREQIYSFYFDDGRGEDDIVIRELFLPKPCIDPPEPPLSKVCALVGEECLPLYYARCALSIRTVINRTRDCFWLTGGWYRSIAPYKLARIRTVLLNFSFTRRYGSGVEVTFTIRLTPHGIAWFQRAKRGAHRLPAGPESHQSTAMALTPHHGQSPEELEIISMVPSFLTLPRELRERIYMFAFISEDLNLGKLLSQRRLSRRPLEPGITRVCRLLRAESIPLYYANGILVISSWVRCDSYSRVWLKTNDWYHGIPQSILGYPRRLQVRYRFTERYFGEPVEIVFEIWLLKRNNDFTLTHSFGDGWLHNIHRKGDPADCDEVLQVLKQHLTATLQALVLKPGIGAFSANDLDRLVNVDPDTLPI